MWRKKNLLLNIWKCENGERISCMDMDYKFRILFFSIKFNKSSRVTLSGNELKSHSNNTCDNPLKYKWKEDK